MTLSQSLKLQRSPDCLWNFKFFEGTSKAKSYGKKWCSKKKNKQTLKKVHVLSLLLRGSHHKIYTLSAEEERNELFLEIIELCTLQNARLHACKASLQSTK